MASTKIKKQCQLKHTPGTETVGSKQLQVKNGHLTKLDWE